MGGYSVQQILVYPVKACRAVSVPCAAISSTGLLYDREWMVVSADKGRLIAQVLAPKLALVTPSLPAEAFKGEALGPNAMLEIQAPGMPLLKIPLKRPALQANSALVNVNIYGWEGQGVDEGSKAASWWSSYLGRPVRFVRFNPALVDRQVEHAPDGYQTGFTNTGQFLVASEASLEDLNKRLPRAVSMNRFRPNFIINGPPAFEEDKWGRFSITHSDKELQFTFVHPCARCKVPTINQENPEGTGEEPLKTLATFRTGKLLQVNVGGAKQVFFGTYFVCANTLFKGGSTPDESAFVAVNDPLIVAEFTRKTELTDWQ
ncbi:unnamed protein product [Calypogeia fissa]